MRPTMLNFLQYFCCTIKFIATLSFASLRKGHYHHPWKVKLVSDHLIRTNLLQCRARGRSGANSTMRAALDEAKGTDAFFHVFVAARNALDIVAATSLRGSGTATLGRNEAAIAAKAGDLAAFSSVLVSSAAAPTRFGRHRKATGPTKTQTICRRLAAALDVLGVTCCIATAVTLVHASTDVTHGR
mmetsp:Transcript_14752/g.23850  ORF Transcript_14752/g.23850 Transcript_14752/m.23850 type:complete len:186 (-) Transcript_14752:115-672(-)